MGIFRMNLTPTEKKLSEILAAWDPEGLIKTGAPADEYDSEARHILEQLDRRASVDLAATVIAEVFQRSFYGEQEKIVWKPNDKGVLRCAKKLSKLLGGKGKAEDDEEEPSEDAPRPASSRSFDE